MAVGRNLTIIFTLFYVGVVIYLLLFFLVPDIQSAIIKGRQGIANLTEGPNYFWALLISFTICLIGSASIGFPVPFPFVLFSLSNSVYIKYRNYGLIMEEILLTAPFWFEIMGIAIAGGLGCALGELTSYLIGRGAKYVPEIKDSKSFENVQGLCRLILEKPNRMYFYIFLAAALPIPDDPLWIALGMTERKFKFFKCLLWGWAGKNITTIFYVILPLLIMFGLTATGMEVNDISSVITEAIMLLVSLTIIYFIMAFDWNKYVKKKTEKSI